MKYKFFDLTKRDRKHPALKEIRINNLFIPGGAMDALTNPKRIFFGSVLFLTTIKTNDGQLVGWAAVFEGYKIGKLESYPHVGAYIDPKFRGKGLAHKAIDHLLTKFKPLRKKADFSYKTFGFSVSSKIFTPILKKHNFRHRFIPRVNLEELILEIHVSK